jgi:hypothetical protein
MIDIEKELALMAGSYMSYFMLHTLCRAVGFGVISKVYRES